MSFDIILYIVIIKTNKKLTTLKLEFNIIYYYSWTYTKYCWCCYRISVDKTET